MLYCGAKVTLQQQIAVQNAKINTSIQLARNWEETQEHSSWDLFPQWKPVIHYILKVKMSVYHPTLASFKKVVNFCFLFISCVQETLYRNWLLRGLKRAKLKHNITIIRMLAMQQWYLTLLLFSCMEILPTLILPSSLALNSCTESIFLIYLSEAWKLTHGTDTKNIITNPAGTAQWSYPNEGHPLVLGNHKM